MGLFVFIVGLIPPLDLVRVAQRSILVFQIQLLAFSRQQQVLGFTHTDSFLTREIRREKGEVREREREREGEGEEKVRGEEGGRETRRVWAVWLECRRRRGDCERSARAEGLKMHYERSTSKAF